MVKIVWKNTFIKIPTRQKGTIYKRPLEHTWARPAIFWRKTDCYLFATLRLSRLLGNGSRAGTWPCTCLKHNGYLWRLVCFLSIYILFFYPVRYMSCLSFAWYVWEATLSSLSVYWEYTLRASRLVRIGVGETCLYKKFCGWESCNLFSYLLSLMQWLQHSRKE